MNDLSMMAARPSRVPRALQAVFLASNRGKEVNRPPAEACKEFKRKGFFFQRTVTAEKLKESPKESRGRGLFFRRKAKRRDSIKSQMTDENCVSESFTIEPSTPSSSPVSLKSLRVHQEDSVDAKTNVPAPVSPQEYLDSIMKSRGYPTQRHSALETGYRNAPTPLQLASYDMYLINLVRKGDSETFRAIFKTGISTNPCNANGESLLHTVCRRGGTEFLRIMLEEAESTVQVADDYGRTPLHDALWSLEPCYDKVKLLLDRDVHLIQLADARGSLPLSYTRQEHWGLWNQFLDDIKDCYWPEKCNSQDEPPLALLKPHSQTIMDPLNALSPDIAAMVAGGRLSPEEAIYLRESNNDEDDDEDEDSDDDDNSDSSFDSDSDESSSSSFDEEEMSNLFALCRSKRND